MSVTEFNKLAWCPTCDRYVDVGEIDGSVHDPCSTGVEVHYVSTVNRKIGELRAALEKRNDLLRRVVKNRELDQLEFGVDGARYVCSECFTDKAGQYAPNCRRGLLIADIRAVMEKEDK